MICCFLESSTENNCIKLSEEYKNRQTFNYFSSYGEYNKFYKLPSLQELFSQRRLLVLNQEQLIFLLNNSDTQIILKFPLFHFVVLIFVYRLFLRSYAALSTKCDIFFYELSLTEGLNDTTRTRWLS